ncbi:MAG: nucleotidyltransferase family protein [Acidimicrobiia bacterium]
MSSVAVILAADPGQGFSGSKYLTPIDGVPMLDRVVSDAATWPVDEVIVVLGADADTIEEGCDLSNVSVLVDPEWEEGGAAPLRAVLDLLSRQRSIRTCVLARGDQPGVTAETVEALLDVSADDIDVVFPKYRYARGWPIVVASGLWEVLLRLEGDMDLPSVVSAHTDHIDEVWFDSIAPAIYESPDDLTRLS